MAKIGIVHTDLKVFGGGDDLCLNVIESLQNHHELELLTLTDPDFETLNEHFGVAVDPIPVHRISEISRQLWTQNNLNLGLLASSIFCRGINLYADKYDMLFSTVSEFNFKRPSIQYIHFPRHAYRLDSISNPINIAYERTCESLTGYSVESVSNGARLLANSEYTKDLVEDIYNTEVGVVYPPVEVDDLNPEPWENREEGFISIGTVNPSKRQLLMIEILEKVRSLGHDIHYHIVGQLKNSEYVKLIQEKTENKNWIYLEGKVSRERIVNLLSSHRYALHGMPNEHFGIAIAEMVAAGTVPFIPNGGGQREVVKENEALCYEDKEDAVEKIDRLLSNEKFAQDVRNELPEVRERFGKDRFKREIQAEVNTVLKNL